MGSPASKKTKALRPKRRRTAFRVICALVVVGIAFPLWFGALVWVVIAVVDVGESARVRSVGYSSLAIRAIDVDLDGIRVRAEAVSVATPVGWLWRTLTTDLGVAPVSIDDWSLVIDSKELGALETEDVTPDLAVERYQILRDLLRRWAPVGNLRSGRIDIDGTIILVDRVDWTREQIEASLAVEDGGTAEISLSIAGPEGIDASVEGEFDGRPFRGSAALGPKDGLIRGDARLGSDFGTARVESSFGSEDWMPKSVDLTMDDIVLPGEFGKEFGTLELIASVRAMETDERLAWNVELNQRSENSSSPMILGTLSGSASLGGRVEALDLSTPWVDVALMEPVEIWTDNEGWRWPEASLFVRSASDLSLQGTLLSSPLEATVQLSDSGGRFPRAVITGGGAFPLTEGIGEARVDVDARFEWPKLEVTRLNAGAGETSLLRVSGEYDWEALRVADVEVSGTVKLSEFGDWEMESGYPDTIEIEAHADGSLAELSHRGRLKSVAKELLDSSVIDLEMQWRGDGVEDVSVSARGQALGLGCLLDADIRLGEDSVEITIPKLEYGPNGLAPLTLETPFRAQLSGYQSGFEGARLRWEGMRLRSGARSLELRADVNGVDSGSARALIEGFSQDWLPLPKAIPVDDYEVGRLLVDVSWRLGKILGELQFDGNGAIGDRRFTIGLGVTSHEDSLSLERASVSLSGEGGVRASGKLPLGLRLDDAGFHLASDPTSTMDLQGVLDIGALLDAELPGDLGLEYTDVDGRFSISGSVENPRLGWAVSAGAIDWAPQPASSATWGVSGLRFEGSLTRRSLDIQEFGGRIEGSPFRANLSIPFIGSTSGSLLNALSSMAADWKRLTGSLELEPARLLDPAIDFGAPVYPGGTLAIDLEVRPAFGVYGGITLNSLSFGPISTLGSFRDFSGQLLFNGDSAQARDITGEYKGRPVELSGEFALPRPESGWTVGGDYFARLKTADIPLAQQAGLIVRSDIDLTLRRSAGDKPEISGVVRLRDGLLLANANELFTPGAISPEQRPPFFSVDIPPFNEWGLNVSVVGDRFLKAKTPVFQGEISSDLKLSQSLGEPQAIGVLRIENGTARFPFANLDITRGSVRLTPENPYHPVIDAVANGRLYGYDISARVSGGVDDPRVRLESSPPLRPEAILLMLTTGESPRDTVRLSSAQKRSRLAMYFGNSVLDKLGFGGGDRVSISTGEDVTVDGRVTTSIEYRLSDIWAATLEYDRFNAVNAGMKFRLISR